MLRRHFLLSAFAQDDPRAFAERLSRVYGQKISDVVYTQTFSLVGRLRLGHAVPVTGFLSRISVERLPVSRSRPRATIRAIYHLRIFPIRARRVWFDARPRWRLRIRSTTK